MQRFRIFLMVLIVTLCVVGYRLNASAPHTITIAGAGSAVQIAATGDLQAASIQFTTPTGNTGVARIGGSTTSSTVGEALPANSGQYFPPDGRSAYSLNTWYAYVASGDTLTIVWTDRQ